MRLFIEYHKLRLIVILFKKSLSNIFPLFYNLIDVSLLLLVSASAQAEP